jgi:Subtilase family
MNDKSVMSRIVVKFQDYLKLQYHPDSELKDFFSQSNIPGFEKLFEIFPSLIINNLFPSVKPERIRDLVSLAGKSDPAYQTRDLLSYFAFDCPPDIRVSELLRILSQFNAVELAYLETGSFSPATWYDSLEIPVWGQEYLNPAPLGIDAKYAWSFPGGDGTGNVSFIDIEKGWILNHEAIHISTLPQTGINRTPYADHGAGVLGIIMMRPNDEGAIGIVPGVKGYVISQYRSDGSLNTSDAILAAIDNLHFGDILLLEAQVLDSTESGKMLPVEIQDAIYSVIRLASALGIIVIEAGGNGNLNGNEGNDFDQFRINGEKILDPNSPDFRDSGAIIVAASSHKMPYNRICFSNYGDRMNCFAWGESVMTAGDHRGYSGLATNTYTGNFGGTSSASAIIAGTAIAVQSIKEANHHSRFSPVQMRKILSDHSNSTPSANGSIVDKIGVMPDLKRIIEQEIGILSYSQLCKKQVSY